MDDARLSAIADNLASTAFLLRIPEQEIVSRIRQRAGTPAAPEQNGPTVPLAAVQEIADELRRILEPLGCGQFEVPSFDNYDIGIDRVAEQAADAAYEAARDAVNYADALDLPDMSEVESFADTAGDAVRAAKDLQDKLSDLIAQAENPTTTEV
jgi:hypothetical protein